MASICWTIWKTRNRSCFEKKFLKNPVDLIYLCAAFMKYWASLHSTADAVQLQQGADALLNLALGTSAGRNVADTSVVHRLTNRADGDIEIDEDEDSDDLGGLNLSILITCGRLLFVTCNLLLMLQ
jgi:hypothetical protein